MPDIARGAWSPPNPGDVGLAEALRQAAVQVTAASGIDGAGFLLLDGDWALRHVAASGTVAQALEVAEELCVEGPCHEAFVGGDVRYVDVQSEGRWARLRSLLSAMPVRTIIGVPITLRGDPIGALSMFSGLPRVWNEADFDALHRGTRVMAQMIDDALDQRLDDHSDGLTARLRAAMAHRPRLHAAAEMITQSVGLDRAGAMLRLRQLAAASDQSTIEVAEHVLARGSLPSIVELGVQARASRRVQREMDRLAVTDPLTGLANRMLLLDHLEQALTRGERNGERPAVLFLDLDRFKTVNDSLGHEAGDTVLRAVAHRLWQVVRDQGTVARLGGDEFAVLVEAPCDTSILERLAARIITTINEPIVVSASVPGSVPGRQHEVRVRASVGITDCADPSSAGARDVLRDADMAMYAAKLRGGGRVERFTEEIRDAGHRRMRIELLLRTVLDAHGDGASCSGSPPGIRLVYQPIVDVVTGRIISVEALVRHSDHELGEVSAPELIAIAESSGLIVRLGTALLSEACGTAAGWLPSPLGAPPTISVNISPVQLMDPGFVAVVDRTLQACGLAPERLCLEITESELLESGGSALESLQQLRSRGVRFALDDFGTGYSSLSYLSRLPVSLLKLDRTFVAESGREHATSTVAQAVVALGRSLGLTTVAEGVETVDELEDMRRFGCQYVQGYLYSRPVEADRIIDLLRDGALEVA